MDLFKLLYSIFQLWSKIDVMKVN